VWVISIAQSSAGQGRLPLSVREVSDADDKHKRLYRLIEDGMTEIDDVLKGWDFGFADVYRSGAPFRTKLQTHMLLKLRYNFQRQGTRRSLCS
jgi:hypothetical protein